MHSSDQCPVQIPNSEARATPQHNARAEAAAAAKADSSQSSWHPGTTEHTPDINAPTAAASGPPTAGWGEHRIKTGPS